MNPILPPNHCQSPHGFHMISCVTDNFTYFENIYFDLFKQIGKPKKCLFYESTHTICRPREGYPSPYEILIDQINQCGVEIDSDTVVVFDGKAEGLIRPSFPMIADFTKNNEVAEVYYISGSAPSELLFDSFKKSRIDDKIKLVCYNHWEVMVASANRSLDYLPYYHKSKLKNKTFHCFNGGNRWNRVFFIALLEHFQMLNKGIVSYNHQPPECYEHRSLGNILTYLEQLHPSFTNLYQNLLEISYSVLDRIPHTCNIYKDTQDGRSHSVPSERDRYLYEGTHLSVITETAFNSTYLDDHNNFDTISDPCTFMTEKTFRQIAIGLPFIIVGHPGCLQSLRNMGYKTFHPWIDESYDAIQDDQERMIAIVKELKRLDQQTAEQWEEWHEHVDKITNFNRAHIFQAEDLYEIFDF